MILISFKPDKNVGNFLVRRALKTNEQPGTFKCACSRCKTCLLILNISKISGSKRSVKIINRFTCTCTSANVIYCITCTLCNKLYIGETGRRPIPRRMTRMHLSQSLVILMSLTTPKNTWLSVAFPTSRLLITKAFHLTVSTFPIFHVAILPPIA